MVAPEVTALGLLWQRSVAQACSGGGRWLRPATSEVADSCPVLPRSLALVCSLSGGSLVPAPVEFVALDLLRLRSLAQASSSGDSWLRA